MSNVFLIFFPVRHMRECEGDDANSAMRAPSSLQVSEVNLK